MTAVDQENDGTENIGMANSLKEAYLEKASNQHIKQTNLCI